MDGVRGALVTALAGLLLATGCDPGAGVAGPPDPPTTPAAAEVTPTATATATPTPTPTRGAARGPRAPRVAPAPRAGRRVDVPFPRAVRLLRRAPERSAGYDRDAFVHWTDADSDGCDTRDEVLLAETVRPRRTRVEGDCEIVGGAWRSAYDGVRTTDSSALDVDHVVPLADAWASGARGWTAARRQRFANDLGDPRSLAAVTASSNRSKSDRDPGEWLPDLARCRYVRDWVAVKVRWDLAADAGERTVLQRRARSCGGRVAVRVVR